MFQEFDPLPLAQHAGKPSLAFDTFDAALDAFFAKASHLCCLALHRRTCMPHECLNCAVVMISRS